MIRDSVKAFYDSYGWKTDAGSRRFLGEILHEDLSEAAQAYLHANEIRYQKHFAGGGRFFLDAGSGSEPRVEMSGNFQKHVCADISLRGLQGARERLRDRGLYVVADLAALPFQEGCFDSVLASHCLYHVDKDLQPTVLREFYRVIKDRKNIVVFYHSQYNLLFLLGRVAKGILGSSRRAAIKPPPPLYFYGHNPLRLAREFAGAEVTCLRTLKRVETEILGKFHVLNVAIPICEFLEKTFPRAMVYIGEYAAIRIQKTVNHGRQ